MRLFSVDIWDTVLRRVCHPDDIKRATARYLLVAYGDQLPEKFHNHEVLFRARVDSELMIAQSAMQAGFDDEYEIHDVFKRWLDTVIGNSDKEIVTALYEYELEQEKKCSYIAPGIVEEIRSHTFDRLCYVSDFYADFVDQLLDYHGFPFLFDSKYVSCIYKVNKRSGRLFDIVKAKECPEQWTHIGDNPYSDVSVPKKRGIQAKLYKPNSSIKGGTITEKFAEMSWDRHEKQLGARLGVFFYAFVADIIEKSVRYDIDCIYYFTREGEFFKQIHDEIVANNPYGVNLPRAEILEVSRKSTFAPSLNRVSTDEMMRLWNQYSVQPIAAMFQSLDVEIADFLPLLERYQIPIEYDIVYPWADERIRRLFADCEFIKKLELLLHKKREETVAYLKNKGINRQKNLAIVDIGWRGTIQDNLCYLFPEKNIIGFYIALLPFLNEQPANAVKHGYLNESPLFMELMKCITPFEMICNSPNGSTLSYQKNATGIFAKRKVDDNENLVFYGFTQYFQHGVLKVIPEICKYCDVHGLIAKNIYEKGTKSLYDFFNNPDKAVVKTFFSLKHNEEFGLGGFIDKRTRFRPFLFIMAVFSTSKRRELADFLRKTNWVQGYLKKYHISPLIQLYKAVIKRGGTNR